MPAALVKTMADDAGITLEEAEKRWKQAKGIAAENGLHESDGEEFWKYVTGVFKKSLGIMESAILESAVKMSGHDAQVRKAIVQANAAGLRHRGNDDIWWSYHTPVLQAAYDYGKKGIDLSRQPDFEGPRFGAMPASGISMNHSAGTSERGLSLAVKPDGKEVGSAVWFADRKNVKVKGLLLPKTGSDGEALILPYGVDVSADAITESATAEEVHAAAHEAATSHLNDLPQPTEAMLKAGVYKKGRIRLHGMEIAIENPKGSTRSGVDADGKPWSCVLPGHYGDIKRTEGADGDALDITVGDHPESELVCVVDQIDEKTGKFDEHKSFAAVLSLKEAKDLYIASFSDGKGAKRLGAITPMHVSDFKEWYQTGDTTKPLSDAVLESADVRETAINVANHHCAKNICPECQGVSQCRCPTPKNVITHDVCYWCKTKGNPNPLAGILEAAPSYVAAIQSATTVADIEAVFAGMWPGVVTP